MAFKLAAGKLTPPKNRSLGNGPRTYFSNFKRLLVEPEQSLNPHLNKHELNFHMHIEKSTKVYQKMVKIHVKMAANIAK